MKLRKVVGLAALAAVVASVGVGEGQAGGGVPIFACGQTVFRNAFLTTHLLDCPGDGIVVGADGVTIDLKGFTVDGNRSLYYGVSANGFDRVTVKNGVVRDFYYGVAVSNGAEASVSGVVASGNLSAGLYVVGDAAKIQSSTASANAYGIYVSGDAAKIQSSTASGNGSHGITVLGDGASVKSSSAAGNGAMGIIVDGDAARVAGNQVRGNGFAYPDGAGLGIRVTGSAVGKNAARGNDDLDECDPASLC